MQGLLDSFSALSPWIADALVILGVFGMTVGMYGIVRMPDVYNKLHAASKVVFLGVAMLLLASVATSEWSIILRALLIGVFLALTTPVSAHVIGRAAYLRRYKMQAADAVNESGRSLDDPESSGASDGSRA